MAAQATEPRPGADAAGTGHHDGTDGRLLRRRADGVTAGQKEAMELALGGAPLSAVLGVLARTAEVHCSVGSLAMVLSLDEEARRFRLGAGGSLPQGFQSAFDGLELGPAAGPCADAALSRENIGDGHLDADGGRWPAFRALALAHGLRSCWVAPVLSSRRQALGVVALFRRDERQPTADDAGVVQELVHSAALVLEHERADRKLRRDERHQGDFLGTLAHELRNPLAPLRNALELMERAGSDAGLLARARSIMSRQVDELARLIDELSGWAHEAGRAAAPPDTAQPAPVLPTAADGATRPAREGEARRVLVADDNDLVRESFVELLEREGYEVRTAVDGLQALEIAERWQPQVVMLDIHMPRLSGLETARRLRAAFSPQAMTLLMMSGVKLNDAWVRHAKAAGFDACIDKTSGPQTWLAQLR